MLNDQLMSWLEIGCSPLQPLGGETQPLAGKPTAEAGQAYSGSTDLTKDVNKSEPQGTAAGGAGGHGMRLGIQRWNLERC